MKKIITLALALMMLLALAGCGEKNNGDTGSQQQNNAESNTADEPATSAPVQQNSEENNTTDESATSEPAQQNSEENNTTDEPATSEPVQQDGSGKIAPAVNGTLNIGGNDIAIVINGTSVPMPYSLKALEAAGVPADESRSDIMLGAEDFFSANLYLDENEDYLLIPAYYNYEDFAISITEANAEEITMTTYSDDPVDQGVSIFGVTFGMPRSEVKAMLGEPDYDSGTYFEWHVEAADIAYEGTLYMYFTEDADDAGVTHVDLSVHPQ